MNTVEPIRNFELILDIQDYLLGKKNQRDYVLFMFGLYSGLRISDILKIKVRDVRDATHIYLRENKTGKEQRIPINAELKPVIKEYIKDKRDYEYLFTSTRGNANKPISRQRVWQILNDIADFFEYKDPIGCHTLRKTFGYWFYQNTKDIVSLKEIFNHSDESVTRRYIGITQDSKEALMKSISFSGRKHR